jgi:hypothetical protein
VPTKQAIIDVLIGTATQGQFTGDKRDGEIPPITNENFFDEARRCGAEALRARLSRMSYAELLRERDEVARSDAELWKYGEQQIAMQEARDREAEAQAFRRKQADRGRRNKLQFEILEVARYYRGRTIDGRKTTALKAWREIREHRYPATTGTIVAIEVDGKNETMCVRLPDGTKKRSGIQHATWLKHYWPAAAKPTPLSLVKGIVFYFPGTG